MHPAARTKFRRFNHRLPVPAMGSRREPRARTLPEACDREQITTGPLGLCRSAGCVDHASRFMARRLGRRLLAEVVGPRGGPWLSGSSGPCNSAPDRSHALREDPHAMRQPRLSAPTGGAAAIPAAPAGCRILSSG